MNTKRCGGCKEEKVFDLFSRSKAQADGRGTRCKDCASKYHKLWYERNQGKAIRGSGEWYQSNKGRARDRWLQRTFGITGLDFEEMLATQKGKCAICEADNPGVSHRETLFVDHCHKTGKVRGLLCHKCNSGLGSFRDSPHLLLHAADYLARNLLEQVAG